MSTAADAATSPWVRQRAGGTEAHSDSISVELGASHDGGLLQRGIRVEPSDD
jgi:hypothetical protein